MVQNVVRRFFFKEGSKVNQILIAVLINLPVLAYGAAVGWMSPTTLLLQSSESPRGEPLSDEEISWMASSTYITAIPAVFVFGYLADKWGRKISLLITSAQFAACWIIKLSSVANWAMVLARVLVGTGVAGCYVITPLYVKEISEDSIRGALGTLVILSQTVGNLLLYILGDIMEYRALLWTCLAMPVLHLVLFLAMPETPAFLIRQKKEEETAKVLGWLRCRSESDPVILQEMEILRKEQEQEKDCEKFALKAIVTDKILFRAFRIVINLCIAREVCGAIPVLVFASDIFKMAAADGSGLLLSPNQQAMLLGGVQVAGALLASSVVEKTGRKPLLMTTSFVSGLGMFFLALWFLLQSLKVWTPDWIPIAALCVCIFCDASGLQPVSFVVLSEMFAFQHRSTVTPVAMGIACAFDFIQLRFFKPLATSFGVHYTFFIFSAICLANTAYIAIWVPETKMRSLEDIYEDLKTDKERKQLQNPAVENYKNIDNGA